MKKILLLIIFIINIFTGYSQKEGNQWYFGNLCGLNFNTNPPTIIEDSKLSSVEGGISISDSLGNLLFYSDGVTVWNKNNDIMQNGDSLNGDKSSSQTGICLKLPNYTDIYYFFTLGSVHYNIGLQYSIIDMNLNGGLGGVLSKNNPVFSNTAEKITAIEHQDKGKYWIIVQQRLFNNIYAYLFTENGLEPTPVITEIGTFFNENIDGTAGCITANSRGDKIALCVPPIDLVDLFDFDNSTGKLTNHKVIDVNFGHSYGLEFSPNGNLLYVSKSIHGVYQYDIMLKDEREMMACAHEVVFTHGFKGTLQYASNGKIYLAEESSGSIHSISKPDKIGGSCDFNEDDIIFSINHSLQNPIKPFSRYGLTNYHNTQFINGDTTFYFSIECNESIAEFYLASDQITDITWDFNDINSGIHNESNLESPKHKFSDIGIFEVSLKAKYKGKWFTSKADVNIKPRLDYKIPSYVELCLLKNELLSLEEETYEYYWHDGKIGSNRTFSEPGMYYVDIYDGCFCPRTDSINVTFVECCFVDIPNAFTPNNDQINDLFKPMFTCDLIYSSMKIYNRWGKELVTLNKDESWNGEINGHMAQKGMYIYKLEYIFDGRTSMNTTEGVFLIM